MRADPPPSASLMADQHTTTTSTDVQVVERDGLAEEDKIRELVGDRLDFTPFEFRRPWMRAFVGVLARTGDVSSAARAAEINYSWVFTVKKGDPVFAAAWREAEQIAADLLEQIAITRATTGEERIVTRTVRKFESRAGAPGANGEAGPVQHVLVEEIVTEERARVKSDALLMFLLKARRPEVFRERVDPSRVLAGDGGPVEVYRPLDLERARAIAILMVGETDDRAREHEDIEHGNANGVAPAELPPA